MLMSCAPQQHRSSTCVHLQERSLTSSASPSRTSYGFLLLLFLHMCPGQKVKPSKLDCMHRQLLVLYLCSSNYRLTRNIYLVASLHSSNAPETHLKLAAQLGRQLLRRRQQAARGTPQVSQVRRQRQARRSIPRPALHVCRAAAAQQRSQRRRQQLARVHRVGSALAQ